MFSAKNLSQHYHVRHLTEEDLDALYQLCASQPDYYQYLGKPLSRKALLRDLTALPPAAQAENKHYLGYFDGETLCSVLELVFAYPDEQCVLLGFFMLHHDLQGQGIGSRLIGDLLEQCRTLGYQEILLSYAEPNRQSEHFWLKQGFTPTGDVDDAGVRLIAMSKWLTSESR